MLGKNTNYFCFTHHLHKTLQINTIFTSNERKVFNALNVTFKQTQEEKHLLPRFETFHPACLAPPFNFQIYTIEHGGQKIKKIKIPSSPSSITMNTMFFFFFFSYSVVLQIASQFPAIVVT